MNETQKFLIACKKHNLKLQIDNGVISISGDSVLTAQACRSLDNSRELTAGVMDVLKEQELKESKTKFHIFEVEDKHGERFKYSLSCIDEVLQDALDSLGLRVISEY